MTLWGVGRLFMEMKDMYRLLPGLAGLLGSFLIYLLSPLGIVVWIGYAYPLRHMSRFSFIPAVSLPLVALACTGLIVAEYFLSLPAMNAFYAAVNRSMSVPFLLVHTRPLVRTCSAGDKLRAAWETFQFSEARFRVMADAALPFTLRHQPRLQTIS